MVQHNVVRILGYLPGGEVWSVTPKFASPLGCVEEYDDLLAWAQAIGAYIQGLPTNNRLRGYLSNQAGIEGVRVEYRDAANQLAQAAEFIFTTRLPGNGVPNKPYQCSVVASLRTGRPGRSFRGRLYWPCLSGSLSTATMRLLPDDTGVFATNMAELLDAMRTSSPLEHDLMSVVVSLTTDTYTGINEIQVGDIIDTQRRRRDSLLEGIVSRPFPPAP